VPAGHPGDPPPPGLHPPEPLSITAPPPTPSGADPDDLRSAWYAASRRRLGLTEAAWYDPAVEHVIQALTLDEPLDAAVTELGNARGSAGFDLRETASDLDALAEILPAETAERVHDEGTVPALSAWADAFIDRVHSPACVDALTGLVTPAYLRVRLIEVHRDCVDRRLPVGDAYALVVAGPDRPAVTPLARLAARLRAGRCLRDWFPGGESACHLDGDRVLVLAPRDDRLAPRTRGLAAELDGDGPGQSFVWPVADRLPDAQGQLDVLVGAAPSNGEAAR